MPTKEKTPPNSPTEKTNEKAIIDESTISRDSVPISSSKEICDSDGKKISDLLTSEATDFVAGADGPNSIQVSRNLDTNEGGNSTTNDAVEATVPDSGANDLDSQNVANGAGLDGRVDKETLTGKNAADGAISGEVGEEVIKESELGSKVETNAAIAKEDVAASVPLTPSETFHHVKWIQWSRDGGSRIPVVTQNENGPCPLLALANVLFMRGQARLEPNTGSVSSQYLLDVLRDCIIRMTPQELDTHRADYQRNVEDALSSLPKLLTGIDVNVRFSGVDQFEYTPDCLVFDLLNIPLYHGWLVEPEHSPLAEAVGQFTYNQLVEYIIAGKSGTDHEHTIIASQAEDFLEDTASQLTYRGLCELNSFLKDGALCVFFRNNHFTTLLKHGDELFVLVTDQGFLHEPRVVWESLNSVDGDSRFVDVQFQTIPPKPAPVPSVECAAPLADSASPQEQIDHDLMVALSLEEQERANLFPGDANATAAASNASHVDYDRQLALKLQEEEEQLAAQENRATASPSSSHGSQRNAPDSGPSASGQRNSGKKDKCCIF